MSRVLTQLPLGKNHRWAVCLGRNWKLTHSRIGEAPGWQVRLYDERPGRRGDRLLIHRIICGFADVEDACCWSEDEAGGA